MADHPLRSATHRRLGGPLPHQLSNGTRAHPKPINLLPQSDAAPWSYAVLANVSICYPPVWDRLLTRYSPVRRSNIYLHPERIVSMSSLDLHVLSTPPAFVLSQDQTLMFNPFPSPLLPVVASTRLPLSLQPPVSADTRQSASLPATPLQQLQRRSTLGIY